MSSAQRLPLYSLSMVCRLTINLHALNNEGNERNRLIPRQATIVAPHQGEEGESEYQVVEVNAISGLMMKRIFIQHLHHIALERGLPLCDACRHLHSNRMLGNAEFLQALSDKDNNTFWDTVPVGSRSERQLNRARVTDQLLTCVIDDLGGILIPVGDGVKRPSPVEFGWVHGLPDYTRTTRHVHTRHGDTPMLRQPILDTPASGASPAVEAGLNSGQMLYERPSSSGVYGLVVRLKAYEIAYNRYARDYPEAVQSLMIDRQARFEAALLTLAQTLLSPQGALTATQLPHVVGVEGCFSVSTAVSVEAPAISPLHDDYQVQLAELAPRINRLHGPDVVRILPFRDAGSLYDQLAILIDQYEPAALRR